MFLKQAHFPGSVPIDAYGNGGFRFAEMSHRGSIMALPSGIYAWHVAEPDELSADAFERVFAESEPPQLMLVGTGRRLVPAAFALRMAFRERTIGLEMMDTGAAARTYNLLLAEGRSIGAALIAID